MSMKEDLAEILAVLESDEIKSRIEEGSGICGYAGNRISTRAHLTFARTRFDAFETWPRFSGDVTYPIPHPWSIEQRQAFLDKHEIDEDLYDDESEWAEAAYDGWIDDIEVWDEDAHATYTQWRFELLDHMIAYYRGLLESQ